MNSYYLVITVFFLSLACSSNNFSSTKSVLSNKDISEFMVASYNVENLFDQVDDKINTGYGDYRINFNKKGYSSNYGKTVRYHNKIMNFTEVKIANIKQVMQALQKGGPEIISLQEIESKKALKQLFNAVKDMGYIAYKFSEWEGKKANAVGLGIISKYPIVAQTMIKIAIPNGTPKLREPLRSIQRVKVNINNNILYVYNNHWKSKGGAESYRLATGRALRRDLDKLREQNQMVDFIITGDLNSEYNESEVITDFHNDTNSKTGINTALNSRGDEEKTKNNINDHVYNLHYELPKDKRKTAYYRRFGWSSFDHIIIGSGLYDKTGIQYVDNSFVIANKQTTPKLKFLFNKDSTPHRWNKRRHGKYTNHRTGGYSDHLPVYAKLRFITKK